MWVLLDNSPSRKLGSENANTQENKNVNKSQVETGLRIWLARFGWFVTDVDICGHSQLPSPAKATRYPLYPLMLLPKDLIPQP